MDRHTATVFFYVFKAIGQLLELSLTGIRNPGRFVEGHDESVGLIACERLATLQRLTASIRPYIIWSMTAAVIIYDEHSALCYQSGVSVIRAGKALSPTT